MDRRAFLRTGLAGAAAVALGPAFWRLAYSAPTEPGDGFYGPLQPADVNGIQLPAGFSSRVVAIPGKRVVPKGYVWHPYPDGAACFATAVGGWIYVSNSERNPGGVGTLVFDPTGKVVGGKRILNGTRRNCSGGATPWGTWLSAEEVATGRVYECDPTGATTGVQRPALGTFNHEAVAVDPVRGHLYLTEDASGGRLYRFRPADYADPLTRLTAGVLEAAVVDGSGGVGWLPVPDPLVACAPQVPTATRFNGGEGVWYDSDHVYFTTKGDDTVWDYDCVAERIDPLYQPSDHPVDPALTGVDQVVASRSGDLFVGEDKGTMDVCLIGYVDGVRVVSRFLHVVGQDWSEITGLAFTPDGTRMFFASQRGGPNVRGIVYLVEPLAGFPGFRLERPPSPTPTPTEEQSPTPTDEPSPTYEPTPSP